MANGRIQLIGGPKDYFWSYALGTLVVRFFGVFLVLSMLMIGMLSAGQLFIAIEKRRIRRAPPLYQAPRPAPSTPDSADQPPGCSVRPDTDTVAAIATALHLHLIAETIPCNADGEKSRAEFMGSVWPHRNSEYPVSNVSAAHPSQKTIMILYRHGELARHSSIHPKTDCEAVQ